MLAFVYICTYISPFINNLIYLSINLYVQIPKKSPLMQLGSITTRPSARSLLHLVIKPHQARPLRLVGDANAFLHDAAPVLYVLASTTLSCS